MRCLWCGEEGIIGYCDKNCERSHKVLIVLSGKVGISYPESIEASE